MLGLGSGPQLRSVAIRSYRITKDKVLEILLPVGSRAPLGTHRSKSWKLPPNIGTYWLPFSLEPLPKLPTPAPSDAGSLSQETPPKYGGPQEESGASGVGPANPGLGSESLKRVCQARLGLAHCVGSVSNYWHAWRTGHVSHSKF